MKSYFNLVGLLLLLSACGAPDRPAKTTSLPFYNTADFTPVWLSPDDAGYGNIHTIANFAFTNQLGQTITNKNVAGKIYVANFFFTTCGNICPQMMSNLAKVQDVYGNDPNVLILSHSVTPAHDNVPVLLAYAEKRHINSKKLVAVNRRQTDYLPISAAKLFCRRHQRVHKGHQRFFAYRKPDTD